MSAPAYATETFPLWRQAHTEFIRVVETGAKVLLVDVSELDIREFELAAARLESTMIALQEIVRRTWEASRKLDEGLRGEAA